MSLRHLTVLVLLVLACAAPAAAQDNIREAFGRGEDGEGGIGQGVDLQKKVVNPLAFPLARCNDNSPAIFYYRPAARRQDADKWVINLQGGGRCGSGLSCSERWFSVNTNFGMGTMTSFGFPERTNGHGILNRGRRFRAENPIADYNQIFVHYCSSDTWTGTAENVLVTGLNFRPVLQNQGLPCPTQYTISFLGRRIFEAVIETLRRNGAPPLVYDNPEGGSQTMPDLDEAKIVILSGGSGGGSGVIHNLDHLRGLLPATTRLVGLTDSALTPSAEHMDLSETTLCVNQGLCTQETQNEWDYEEGPFRLWGAAQATDGSCLSYHAGDPYQCADNNHILNDHVTTPYFVRMDLLDPLRLREYQDAGYFIAGTPDPDPSTPEHGPISPLGFAATLRADILRLAAVPRQAHESANINFTPGAFAPACGEHDELRNDDGVYNTAIRRRGKSLKMFDVFEAWVNGTNPAILTATGPADSVCP